MTNKIIEDVNNFLLNRNEIKMIIKAEKNPSFADAAKLIADEKKFAEENIEIKKINGKFGRDTFLIHAFAYKNKEDRDKFEKKKAKKTVTGK